MLTASEKLEPDASGTEVQKTLAQVAASVAEGKFSYSKFFAIGLFRLVRGNGSCEVHWH